MLTPSGRVLLLAEDPDLAEAVPAAEREAARRHVAVPQIVLASGRWSERSAGSPPWGVLLLTGLMTRETAIAGTSSTELLGPGDVILSGSAGVGALVSTRPLCTVLEPARLAVLDDSLTRPVTRWPGLAALLVQRAARRAERLAVAGAVGHLTRVDARVLTMLWALAERWGRVTADGLLVPLPLTHRTLARMVGARRPTVTSAVSDLTRRGLIARRPDGTWELRGAPPDGAREQQPQAAAPAQA